MPTSSNPSASETKTAIAIVLAIADTIRELGSVPSGHVYAHVMHRLSLGQYAAVIELLKKTGKVKEENHLLIWVTETMYQPRPVDQTTTEDLIATVSNDRNDIATFEARRALVARCGGDWRTFAPAVPRNFVDTDGGRVHYHNFHETGML